MGVNPAVLRLLAGAATISSAPVFVRAMSLPATPAAMWRLLIGGAVLAVMVGVRSGGRPALPRRAFVFAALGGVFFAADLWFWHRCIRILGPGVATLLGNLQVLPVALGGWWLWKERPSNWFFLALPVAGIGLGLVAGVGTDTPADTLGVVYGLLTAVTYAGYILGLRAAGGSVEVADPLRDVSVASLVSGLVLVPIVMAEGVRAMPADAVETSMVLGYALIPQVVGWVLIAGALPRVPAATAGLALLIQPVLAMGWDVLLFSRVFGTQELMGAVCLLAAIGVGQRKDRDPDA